MGGNLPLVPPFGRTYADAQVVRTADGGLRIEYMLNTPKDLHEEIEKYVLQDRRANAWNYAHWLIQSYRTYIRTVGRDPAIIDKPFGLTATELPFVVKVMRQCGWLVYWTDQRIRKLYVVPAGKKHRW